MSADVAPPGDISTSAPSPTPPPRPSLSLRHYNTLAVATILGATGMVSAGYIAVAVFPIVYLHFLSKVAFPPESSGAPPLVYSRSKNKVLGPYIFAAAVVGLYLPTAYILDGIISGDKDGITAAVPHLFLLSAQVFMEGASYVSGFSLPVRAFVPVFYNSVRIPTILEWLAVEFSKDGTGRRIYAGRGLAVVNFALWSFNLFGFLLPFYLPKTCKLYYSKFKGS
ncbi:uncharacterized protein LOC127245767 [Andrographis paniculata]|uniref:uncharacterized protein LOC127245767 n=1 Tax=Andrographis paniculata TaxID=175694 RepID=UPI0021E98D8C|nr:uncharacterized protein LOC127245767 [Andrographis paniculata]